MKVVELFEASRGEQVLDFADWLDSGAIPKSKRDDFQKLADELFRKGWTFSIVAGKNPHFFNDDGFEIVVPNRPRSKYARVGRLGVSYHSPTTGSHFATDFYWVEDILSAGLEETLEEVKFMATT